LSGQKKLSERNSKTSNLSAKDTEGTPGRDSILAAIERLRGTEPTYFRDFRNEGDKKASEGVKRWLDAAVRVDSIASDLVKACIDIAISNASIEEEEWLRTGLNLSIVSDLNAKIIIELMDEFNEEPKESPHLLAKRRFQEFAQSCLKIAEELHSFVTHPQGEED
jgi:hypothetical protein